MEKLQQVDIDKLENFISFIEETVVDIESLMNGRKLNKVKLSFCLGKLSMELENKKQYIQDVIDAINDNDLVDNEFDIEWEQAIKNAGYESNKPSDDDLPF